MVLILVWSEEPKFPIWFNSVVLSCDIAQTKVLVLVLVWFGFWFCFDHYLDLVLDWSEEPTFQILLNSV